jgi:hypothetical protein
VKIIEGFKFVRKDGTTHNGYQWPLPTNGKPVKVKADPGDREFTTLDPCPQFEGDGLCIALTARAASSGGVKASEAIGLWLTYRDTDILAQGDGKCRVKAVTVTGIFDVTAWVRTMCAGANLSRTDLSGADLSGANLSGTDLSGADMSGAYLSWANLSGTDLSLADLSRASLSGAYGRDDWDALVARGAIR